MIGHCAKKLSVYTFIVHGGDNTELSELIESIDIVKFLSQYTELTLKGDEYWGLSPLKEEKTPSFSVRQSPPLFYDYSSGTGGNVYSFVKAFYRCSNREAVDILKKFAGCEEDIYVRTEKLSATIECKKYLSLNKHPKESKAVVLKDDYMERYEDSDEKLNVWKNEGISDSSLRKFQVKYDSFSDRLVYPIRNIQGQIVNVGGRTLDSRWKEKGFRKYTYFFGWGTIDTIYGVSENMESIRNKNEVILFEGCKSVLLADTWGVHNTGAILTSHLSPNQMKILVGLGCDVVFALDKEVNISNDKNIQKLKRYLNVWYLYDTDGLLDDKDSPVDKGADVFGQLYKEKKRLR